MDDIELLRGILDKTGSVLAGADGADEDAPTPCAEYTVAGLRDHIVGWVQVFAAGRTGRRYDGDPMAYRCGPDAAAVFAGAADAIIDGWRANGLTGTLPISSGAEMPAPMVFNMTVMEYLAHGWDLAVATGQTPPWTEEEAEAALERAEATLLPEYRGDAFAPPLEVAPGAKALDRFGAFMGRSPSFSPA